MLTIFYIQAIKKIDGIPHKKFRIMFCKTHEKNM